MVRIASRPSKRSWSFRRTSTLRSVFVRKLLMKILSLYLLLYIYIYITLAGVLFKLAIVFGVFPTGTAGSEAAP